MTIRAAGIPPARSWRRGSPGWTAAVRGFAYSSGMAAITNLLLLFKQGDHLVVTEDLYGGTFRVIDKVFARQGLTATYVDTSDAGRVAAAIRGNTRAVLLEVPTNPLLKVADIRKISEIAKGRGILTIVDNTFLTPYLMRPLELGADVVVYSATKFISGHNDVLAGLVVVKDEELGKQVYFLQNSVGAVLGPQDCWLVIRGLKTLGVRIDRQLENARTIAEWLTRQAGVTRVYYPGLETDPGNRLLERAGPGIRRDGLLRGGREACRRRGAQKSQAHLLRRKPGGRGIADHVSRLSDPCGHGSGRARADGDQRPAAQAVGGDRGCGRPAGRFGAGPGRRGGKQMKIGTKILHTGNEVDPVTGAVSLPVYHAATFQQAKADEFGPYDYSRSGNPTRDALEAIIASLEGGVKGFAFSSGMAAISSVFLLFSPGDHLVVGEDVYGGTYRVLTRLFSRLGIEATFVDFTDPDKIREAVRPNTRALYLETPSNPLLRITDLRAVSALAKEKGLLSIIDNTFMTPYLQRPFEHGMDIVIHSATKYLGGHSDLIAGLAVVADEKLAGRIKFIQNAFGAVLGPQDCWLLMRGIKTLKARMDMHQKGAARIAEWLQGRPEVKAVFFPGLSGHPGKGDPRASGRRTGRDRLFPAADGGDDQTIPGEGPAAGPGRQPRGGREHHHLSRHHVSCRHASRPPETGGGDRRSRQALRGDRRSRRPDRRPGCGSAAGVTATGFFLKDASR